MLPIAHMKTPISVFTTEQQALVGAEASHKKKEIADARRRVDDAEKKVEEARDKRDALQKSSPQETGLPYNYTEQVHHFTATVEVRFVIKNTTGTAVGPPIPVLGKPEKTYTKLEGVKDTDTMGVHRRRGTYPSPVSRRSRY